MNAKKVIIDCDPGIDDALALMLALSAPGLEILGITVVSGNVPAQTGSENALKVLDWMNRTRDPFRGYQWKCRPWRDLTADWEVDGWTRQYENEPGEYRQKDYSTGLTMVESSRYKKKKETKI